MNAKYLVGSTICRVRDAVLSAQWLPLSNYVPFDRCWPYDVARYAGTRNFGTIIDAGANVGQSAAYIGRFLPGAKFHCFEPMPATFALLSEYSKGRSNISTHQVALSDRSGWVNMKEGESSESSAVTLEEGDSISRIRALSLDEFAAAEKISSIELLKVDVEGHELALLEGARGLLAAGKIQAIYIEFGTHSSDPGHTHLSKIHSALEPFGFVLAGIYDLCRAQPRYHIRFGNALYWNTRFKV